MSLTKLKPFELWDYFQKINAIPRASKKEDLLVAFIEKFAHEQALSVQKDKIGNLIVKKDPTPGMEHHPTIILQSHLDMVHQKEGSLSFDFEKQGIQMYIEGDLVKAKKTTLGADNGIGVAAMMALLASKEIEHPGLEALFTIDEEAGMSGAKHLDKSLLSGNIILNLDTEDDHELTIGCAGGVSTEIKGQYKKKRIRKKGYSYHIKLSGLKGGHSADDIHDPPRANANKLMNRILYELSDKIRMITVLGGGLFNAIPRESMAKIYVYKKYHKSFQEAFSQLSKTIKEEWANKEEGLTISLEKLEKQVSKGSIKVMKKKEQYRLLTALYGVYNGAYVMSPSIKGLVETSSNLAKVFIKKGKIKIGFLQRSSIESAKWDIAKTISAPFDLIGLKTHHIDSYPGWIPEEKSPLLSSMVDSYKKLFLKEPKITATHGGLECGFLKKHFPEAQIISFGPTIKNPHSPNEEVSISSVEKFWLYLRHILKNLKL